MTIKQALTWAYRKLNHLDSPQLDAEVLLSFIVKKNKSYLYTYPEKKLTAGQSNKFERLINKRVKHYSVAYLINKKEFYGFDFYVDERVLIPRPQTETIVETAIKLIKKYKLKTVADIGTGSGCIAISLKKQIPNLKMYATDISKSALAVAKKNSRIHNTKIIFRHGNLIQPVKNIKLDLIITNLPYVDYQNYKKGKSIQHEPKQALLAKNKGLEFNQQLIHQLAGLTNKPQAIILEVEPTQTKALSQFIKKLKFRKITINQDLNKLGHFLSLKY